MKQAFGDAHTAARLRDIFRRIARREIDKLIPPDTFGTVVDIDIDARRATFISTTGDETLQSAPFAAGVPPDVGDIVRVSGRAGARHIVGGGTLIGIPPGGSKWMVLGKLSDDDYDVEWITGASAVAGSPGGGGGGGTGGSATAIVDTDDFVDNTGVATGTVAAYVPWVPTTGTPFIVGPGNVIPVTPSGHAGARVQVAGLYVFSATIALTASTDTEARVDAEVVQVGTGLIKAVDADIVEVPSSGLAFGQRSGNIAFGFAGEVGDVIFVRVTLGAGTGGALMVATVASLTGVTGVTGGGGGGGGGGGITITGGAGKDYLYGPDAGINNDAGVTDNTGPMQTVIDTAGAGATIFLPNGQYKFVDTGAGHCIDIGTVPGVHLIGESSGRENASATGDGCCLYTTSSSSKLFMAEAGSLQHLGPHFETLRLERRSNSGTTVSIKLFNHFKFQDVTFHGNGSSDTGTNVKVDGGGNDSSYGHFHSCSNHYAKFGYVMVGSSFAHWDGSGYLSTPCTNGIMLDFQAGSGHNHVIGQKFEAFTGPSTLVSGVIGIKVNGDGTTPVATIGHFSIEGVATGILLDTGSNGTNQGCAIGPGFFTGKGADNAIVFNANRGNDSVMACRFSNVATKVSGDATSIANAFFFGDH